VDYQINQGLSRAELPIYFGSFSWTVESV